MGGQIGDTGIIKNDKFLFNVIETKKIEKTFLHIGYLKFGELKINEEVETIINVENRNFIMANHTATHILHATLKKVLCPKIEQKGSYLDHQKLRFDFNHNNPISDEKILEIENFINNKIRLNLKVETKTMDIDDIPGLGINTIFNEKYEKKVRVLSIGKDNFSVELCGGTHVENTSEIRLFKIIKESGIGIGIRRIEAITGECAINWLEKQNSILNDLKKYLNCKEIDIKKIHHQTF